MTSSDDSTPRPSSTAPAPGTPPGPDASGSPDALPDPPVDSAPKPSSTTSAPGTPPGPDASGDPDALPDPPVDSTPKPSSTTSAPSTPPGPDAFPDPPVDADQLARWRLAFTSPPPLARDRADPPPAERIWQAVHGELTADETAALAAAMARDPALAEEWQLAVRARDALANAGPSFAASAPAPRPARARGLAVAVASVAALAAALALWLRPDPVEVYRDATPADVWGHAPSTILELHAPTLGWAAIEGARRYRVRLMTVALEPVAEQETTAPALALPHDPRLAPEFAWQVEALAADGALLARSPTFRARWPG